MNSNHIPIILLAVIGITAIVFLLSKNEVEVDSQQTPTEEINYSTVTVKINEKEVSAELADTPFKQGMGLMFREHLDENAGMLFVFGSEGKRAFWMANTKISLDMIWANSNKEIVFIHKNVPPCTETGGMKSLCQRYTPDKPAKYVLEVNGGWTDKNNISIGDTIEIIR